VYVVLLILGQPAWSTKHAVGVDGAARVTVGRVARLLVRL
jgi:hypothetical protein